MADVSMEAVIDFEFLRGPQNWTVVLELCVASATADGPFRFKCPYKVADQGTSHYWYTVSKGIWSTKNCTLWLLKPCMISLTSMPTASLKSR